MERNRLADAPAPQQAELFGALVDEVVHENVEIAYRRDRLLSSLTLIAGMGLAVALPFALRAAAPLLLPITVAMVIALVLAPALEWLERRGLPSGLAALIVLLVFVAGVNAAIVAVVLPAGDWYRLLQEHAGRIHSNLLPVLNFMKSAERVSGQVARALGQAASAKHPQVAASPPNTLVDLIAESAPTAVAQSLFALLLVYFMLASWRGMRDRLVRNRHSLTASVHVARLFRDIVSHTARYILTISAINVALGCLTAGVCWAVGMPTPLMWGGLAALFNFVPYVGPVAMAGLLGLGGLVIFAQPEAALLPAGLFLCLHLAEANLVTPSLVGRSLSISPLAILLGLAFWGWAWGTVGALISVPLLIMARVVVGRTGVPDILGFLFEAGTLTGTSQQVRNP